MAGSIYRINKGINQSIEFRGLKAQYIWYLGGGVLLLLIVFAGLYIAGLPTVVCIGFIGISGTLLVINIYRLSRRYGQYGMMKALARRRLPVAVRVYSREVFLMKKRSDDGEADRKSISHTGCGAGDDTL